MNPAAVLFEFHLDELPDLPAEALAVPGEFSVGVVPAVPATDRAATYHLEQLWAMERGWIDQAKPAPEDLALHLVEDHLDLEQGFTILLRDAGGSVIGMHGAHQEAPGIGSTDYLVVLPEHRGKGLGRTLKAWQLQTAKDVGWRILQSDTPGDPQAEGVRRLNLAMGGRRVEAFTNSLG